MTNEESLEIQSTRYIAPRVMRLSSGNIAIIPMIGRDPPIVIDMDNLSRFAANLATLYDAIPTIDTLEEKYRFLQTEHRRAPASTPRSLQPTLDDLA